MCLSGRHACKTSLLVTLEVQKQSQAHPRITAGGCLGDGISVGRADSSLGNGGGRKPALPTL